MARIRRIDNMDSLTTLFIVETKTNEHQEINVPIWLADLVEANMKSFDFDTEKGKSGETDVLI